MRSCLRKCFPLHGLANHSIWYMTPIAMLSVRFKAMVLSSLRGWGCVWMLFTTRQSTGQVIHFVKRTATWRAILSSWMRDGGTISILQLQSKQMSGLAAFTISVGRCYQLSMIFSLTRWFFAEIDIQLPPYINEARIHIILVLACNYLLELFR